MAKFKITKKPKPVKSEPAKAQMRKELIELPNQLEIFRVQSQLKDTKYQHVWYDAKIGDQVKAFADPNDALRAMTLLASVSKKTRWRVVMLITAME